MINRGYTMSTSREGIHLLEKALAPEHDCVILQFGVVDSHMTFRYAPYILYFPDNPLRKTLRNIVKKYKKMARNSGLNKRLGEARVVSVHEYRANFQTMIERCGDRLVIIPESIPQHESYRNSGIQEYNRILEEVSVPKENCLYIKLFDDFLSNLDHFYLDQGHPNETGYQLIADKILAALKHRGAAV